MGESLFTNASPKDFVEAVRRNLHVWESTEEPMLAMSDRPDWCRLPPELGGGTARVKDAWIIDECPVNKHKGECATVALDGDVAVVACPQCNQFFWIREKRKAT